MFGPNLHIDQDFLESVLFHFNFLVGFSHLINARL